jgi:hypothetical protein
LTYPARPRFPSIINIRRKDKSDARLHVWFGEREYDGAQGVMDITDTQLVQMLITAYGPE